MTAIAAGNSDSLALKSDGTVVAWGCGVPAVDWGQCSVPGGLSDVTAIAAFRPSPLALKGDGAVVAWGCGTTSAGSGNFGQCSVPSGLSGVTAIAAGEAQSLALVVPTNQTITFGALANKTYGDPDFGVGATASSSLAVSFAASGNCTISGAAVHLTGAGSCTVTASQAGSANYNPAPDVARTFSIARATQTITVTLAAPASALVSTSFTVAASAPGGPVSFSSSGVCSNSGAAFTMTSSSGTCTVMFDQSGDANISAAPQVTEAVTAAGGGGGGGGGGGKANQTIAFAALASKTVGDADFALTATASSGLPVAFAATGSCTAAGATVHISGSGSCTATASQAGNGSLNPAPAVSQTFSIAKASQTITFAPLANKTFGAPDFNVNASASSGLAVAFAATGNCALRGTTLP